MIDICVNYFSKHGIKISVNEIVEKSKTKCIAFNVTSEPVRLSLYNLVLPWVNSAIHLGHLITSNENSSDNILRMRGEFISKTHELQQELGN